MKLSKILLIVVFSTFSVSLFGQDTTTANSKMNLHKMEQANYSCPMHPEVISDKPGKCPKCGMDLKEMEKTTQSYSCPMHPEITSDKPGKCSKCGMDLTKSKKKQMKMKGMKMNGCSMLPK